MPAHAEDLPRLFVQQAIPFSDTRGQNDPNTDVVGTVCQDAILGKFRTIGQSISRREIRVNVSRAGHAVSTIDRSLGRLVAKGTLRHDRATGQLILTDVPPPKPVNIAFSRPGSQSNRFGQQSRDDVYDMVRDLLAHRLDNCFEHPNALLRKLITAVEWCGRLAQAVQVDDDDGVQMALSEFHEVWPRGQLTADEFLEALQVSLFPETFAEDPEVRAEIEAGMRRAQRERDNWFAEKVDGDEGNQIPPPGGQNRRVHAGLIPFGGLEKCGRERLQVWLDLVGTKGAKSTA